MKKFVRVVNGVVADVTDDPQNKFHPDIASEFIEAPDDVEVGWIFTLNEEGDEELATPKIVDATHNFRLRVSRPEFKMLFTGTERVAVKQMRLGDINGENTIVKMMLDDFFDLIEDDKLSAIEVDHPQVQDGLAYLVSIGILTEERKTEISKGIPE